MLKSNPGGALGYTHILCVHYYLAHTAVTNHTDYELEKADEDGVNWHFKHVVLHYCGIYIPILGVNSISEVI